VSESLSSVESCELISSSIPSISFVSTSNYNAVSSLMQGTEMLVDMCGSYDDFSGLCHSSARLSALLLYFSGHDAI
jgi:hypothetical protein